MKPEDISAHARRFQRHATTYEARVDPHQDHADQFRLILADAQVGMAVIDVSEGGLALKSGIYIPRNMRLVLHVSSVETDQESHAEALTIRGIIRRCEMLDHKPTYKVGIQFIDPQGRDERLLIESAAGSTSAAPQPASNGGAGVS
jgi:hypothetical protein